MRQLAKNDLPQQGILIRLETQLLERQAKEPAHTCVVMLSTTPAASLPLSGFHLFHKSDMCARVLGGRGGRVVRSWAMRMERR